MCGIVGMVSSSGYGFTHEQRKIFNTLLWADTVRGEDSTGVYGVNKYGNVDFLKTVGHAGVLQDSTEYQEFNTKIFSDYRMVVGHNRKATRGGLTDENAHPFIEGNHILVHNGTLHNHKELTAKEVEVDSHAILHSLVERGYGDTLKEIQGAFALAFYNAVDKELNLVRNDERPLFIANCIGAWYFASEAGLLKWVIGREGIQIKELTNCKPGTMYTFKLEDEKQMWMVPMELYKPPKVISSFPHGGAVHQHQIQLLPPPASKNESEQSEPEEKKDENKGYYNPTDFVIGTRLLVFGDECIPVKAIKGDYDHIFQGKWYFDDDVVIKAFCKEDDLAAFDEDTDDDQILFTAEIKTVISRKGKITLLCQDIKPYEKIVDSANNEIYGDEFMFTDKKCQWCAKPMSFDEVKAGEFTYTSADNYYLICEHCVDKGMHLVV